MKEGGGWGEKEIKMKNLGNLCNNHSWLLVPPIFARIHSFINPFLYG